MKTFSFLFSQCSRYAVLIALLCTVFLFALCTALGLEVSGRPVLSLFEFDRLAIEQGELWRVLTAHLTHLSLNHAFMNLAAAGIVFYLLDPKESQRQQFLTWLWLFAFTGVGLLLGSPHLYTYSGLSGALHGAILVAMMTSPFYAKWVKWLVVSVLCMKVGWEQSPIYNDMANFDLVGGRTEPDAHLYGLIAGWVWLAILWGKNQYEQRR